MLRRELLRSLVGLPMLRHITRDAVSVPLADKRFLVFVNAKTCSADSLAQLWSEHHPNLDFTIIPLRLQTGQTIEDAVRLYEVNDGK